MSAPKPLPAILLQLLSAEEAEGLCHILKSLPKSVRRRGYHQSFLQVGELGLEVKGKVVGDLGGWLELLKSARYSGIAIVGSTLWPCALQLELHS